MPNIVVGGHATAEERNQDATLYVGHLDEKVTESLLWELFLQAGPIQSVHMPKDRVSLKHQGYGFVEFLTEEDADYAIRVLNMIKLFGKPIRVNKSNINQKNLDVGANLFIGNLDPEVDEKLIYDTFSAFGAILKPPHIQRDLETKKSKGYAFVEFDSFDAADAAIEAMNGQYLMNRAISINYAFKKGSKTNERHGTAAERLLASQNPSLTLTQKPNMMFSDNKKDSELSQTVPSAIQQAMPPSLAGAPRFGAPNALHKRAESANTMIPTMNRPPPPGGYPAGFGGMRAPMRAPPPGHFSMTGNYRPQQFATPNPSIMKDGLPSYGNLGVGMKPMHSARYNSPLMAGIQFSGTIHKNGSAFSHLSAVQNQEANLHMTGNMQVFNNPKAPHL